MRFHWPQSRGVSAGKRSGILCASRRQGTAANGVAQCKASADVRASFARVQKR